MRGAATRGWLAIVLAAVGCVSGCRRYYWSKPDATLEVVGLARMEAETRGAPVV
ncbi:MAG TPA: hypothetical protein VIG07_19645 [Methylomirabilota bacterium]|jgi:hypothetical protein